MRPSLGGGPLPKLPAWSSRRCAALPVEPARPEDFARIAELTVGVYVGGGLATAGVRRRSWPTSPAAPPRRAAAWSGTPTARVVGSVALVLDR